jgi:predicted esterase
MKTLFTRSLTILLVITAAMVQTVRGQLIMNPSDTVVTYNGSTTPAQPVYGQIGKWIRTADLESSWNTNEYKCYIYKGYPYRLHFPKSYNPTANDGKKYPLLIFYHGAGEAGPITDNELQLYHGGQIFQNAVDGGTWDGFVLCMQTQGGWGPYQFLSELVDTMVKSYKVDPFHVVNNGLSGGAQGTWEMFLAYPTYIAGLIPMSGVYIAYTSSSIVNEVKFTPIWNLHGGQDGGPAPATAQQVTAAMLAGGADYVDKEYITLGHDTWDSTWEEPNFWPFLLNAYSSNPWTLFGRNQFCPGDVINLTVGLPAGFQAYKWRMNGTIIPGATSNTINVTAPGIYDAQVERSGIWSDWSHHPDTVSIQTPTVTPPITVSGVMSDVLPDAGGQTFVNLQVPAGYASYTWEQASNDSIVGTSQTLKVTKPGSYIVSVTQQYGCSSIFSPPFKVISASGPNPPSPASNLVANALSFTQVQLNWARNPNPVHPEVAFEVYRSTTTGGPYTYVGQAPADTVHFVDSLLTPNKKYYYVVRAIDSTAAAPLSNEANAVTQSDKTPPTAPGNLKVVSTSQTSVSIISPHSMQVVHR